MRALPSGEAGLLVECADLEEVGRLLAAVREHPPTGLLDLVPAARTLLLVLDPAGTTPGQAWESVQSQALPEHGSAATADEVVEVPVTYDGDDLADVAGLRGCDVSQVVRQHTAGTWRVAFCGFAPGFGYLVAEGASAQPPWSVSRRESPRTKVPPGSVALAGEYTGVYPRSSPGGWQLIGRTDLTMFDLERDPPALLVPGTRVRFVEQP